MTEPPSAAEHHAAGRLLYLAPGALVVGVACSLMLLALSLAAEGLQDVLWEQIPDALGADGDSALWIILMLTFTGLAVGMVAWQIPGHAGPDPATVELAGPPLPVKVLPSLALAAAIMLAGGVSLGPENPITAINIGLAFAAGRWLGERAGPPVWAGIAVAGTIGAMFGTPVAAALLLSETQSGDPTIPLWDRLFAPLVAAGAGGLTTTALTDSLSLSLPLPDYRGVEPVDLVSGSIIATAAAAIGMLAVYSFPHVHTAFHRLSHPMMMIPLGGLVLGLVGAIGGQITLFKGLDEMKELATDASGYSSGGMLLIVVVKLVALLVAAGSGFPGGRIFPAVFVGVAIGLLASALATAVPPAVAVSAAVLGILLAVTRSGWLSLFMAIAAVPDITLLPLLCLIMLPAWLIVTGRPEMTIAAREAEQAGADAPPPDAPPRGAAPPAEGRDS